MPRINLTLPGMNPGDPESMDPGMPDEVCHEFLNQRIIFNNMTHLCVNSLLPLCDIYIQWLPMSASFY